MKLPDEKFEEIPFQWEGAPDAMTPECIERLRQQDKDLKPNQQITVNPPEGAPARWCQPAAEAIKALGLDRKVVAVTGGYRELQGADGPGVVHITVEQSGESDADAA